MYSFLPDEEQQMLMDVCRRFAESDIRPAAHEADEHRELPDALLKKGWELGLLQSAIPPEYEGFGERSALTTTLAMEELAYGDLAAAMAILTPALFALPIVIAGSEEQKQSYLPQMATGDWQPVTAALIENQFAFDPQTLGTSATHERDGYLITGEKRWVPFGGQAKSILVYADLDGQTQGFIVPAESDGVTVGERERLLGIGALPCTGLHLDRVLVPRTARLGGPEGHAFGPLLAAMRVANSALALGVARASLDYSLAYAKDREVLGSKVAQKQSIAFMLAEMATEIEATRLLTWEAAWQLDNGVPEANETAYLAVNAAMDMAMMVTDRGVQILGGHGYIREHPVELWMRNGRGFSSFTGLAIL